MKVYEIKALWSTLPLRAPEFDAIPHELKKLKRWVNWRVVRRNGKPTKVPINPTSGEPAKSDDPATWGTYPQAVQRFNRGGVDGIGFELGNGYVGIDIDACRNPATGEIESGAQEIVRDLDSYAEVSPSSGGVHIIARGDLPKGGRRNGHIEMYDSGRYFTMTGWHLEGSPNTIEGRSGAIKSLHHQIFSGTDDRRKNARRSSSAANTTDDAELIDRARKAANGAKFSRLWAGNWQTDYASQSEADLALCSELTFWTERDAGRIDELFRQSGLYREKWEREDYRARTIEKACELCFETWNSQRANKNGGQNAEGQANGNRQKQRDSCADQPSDKALPVTGVTKDVDIGLVKRLADQILLTEDFAQDPGGKLYRFNAGVYKPDGRAQVKRLVKRLLEQWQLTKKWNSSRAEEVAEYVRVDAPELWEQPPSNLVNVQNGLLDLETGQLMPHSPGHLSSVQLPVVFDPAAKCPVWNDFINDVFPDDAQEFAWQLTGWLMVPDTKQQKAVLLLGEGSNGKSTFLSGLSAFLGPSNLAAVSLHRLESDRFSVARLVGKLANICPDLPSSHLVGTSVFKGLVGGDRMLAEYKYRESFEFLPFARLVFSGNHPPRSGDSTHAFFRRWYVVPFTRRFAGGEEIRDMAARLASPRELSGVLNRAVQSLKQIQECKGLIESASMAAAWEEFRKVTDPVAVWLDNWTVEKGDVFVAKNELRIAYNRMSEAAGRPPETETGFGRALHRLRPNLKEGQRTISGKLTWVWVGLGLRSAED